MSRHTCSAVCAWGLAALMILGATSAGANEKSESPAKPSIGDKIAELAFKDIRFLPRTLGELGDKQAYVLVYTTTDCPVVNRYLPKLVELEKEYRDRGVQFVAVNVGPNDPLVEVAYQAIRVGAPFPFVKDFDGSTVHALGVTRTPEIVVLDADRKLRYRGRVDSQYRLGGVKPTAGREDLKEALEDVLAGREVAVAETPVDGCSVTFAKIPEPSEDLTFSEHIAPIVQTHCQDCHRPGASGPFDLITYDDLAGHAEMIAEVVGERRMPPMYASRQHGEFTNLLMLSDDERTKIAQWVATGKKQGDPAKLPEPRVFPDSEWLIGEPDLVLHIPKENSVPADGYIPYQYNLLHKNQFILPYTFPHDTWVSRVQIKPGNGEVMHHCNMAYIDPKGKYTDAQFITGQVPGGIPMVLDDGVAFKIPKGSLLVLQIHYVTVGEPQTDLTTVGFKFADGPIKKQLKHFRCHNGKFAIPAGDPHHEVAAQRTFDCDATAVGMFSHMHLRGKDMVFNAVYPDGRREPLLAIPNYSFDWQMSYVFPKEKVKFPKGTVIDCVAHFDNSAFNPYNPDPSKVVREGDQTFEEMMYGFVFYTDDSEELNIYVDGKTGKAIDPPGQASAGAAADADAGGE